MQAFSSLASKSSEDNGNKRNTKFYLEMSRNKQKACWNCNTVVFKPKNMQINVKTVLQNKSRGVKWRFYVINFSRPRRRRVHDYNM